MIEASENIRGEISFRNVDLIPRTKYTSVLAKGEHKEPKEQSRSLTADPVPVYTRLISYYLTFHLHILY